MTNNSANKTDYSNRFNRHIWINDRRSDLVHYFQTRGLLHGPIEKEPVWGVIPRSSIWKVPSLGQPEHGGWFGIAGDHPTDIVPIQGLSHEPRDILRHFVRKWLEVSERLMRGEECPDFRISNIDQRTSVGELIDDRAKRLRRWVQADELWQKPAPLDDPYPIEMQNKPQFD